MVHAQAVFPPDLGSPRAARQFLAGVLADHSVPNALAILLISELATTAVLPARTDFTVGVRVDSGAVRVEVIDANERPPQLAHTPPEATSGRGLQLVATLSTAWGVEGRRDGKVVWFEVPADSYDFGRERAFAS